MNSIATVLPVLFALSSCVEESYCRRLEGSWTVMSLTWDGFVFEENVVRRAEWTFKGRKDEIAYEENTEKGSHRIIPFVSPPAIDLVAEGGFVSPGIFSVQGDTLKICFTNELGGDRPTDFTSTKGSSRILVILTRKKKPNN